MSEPYDGPTDEDLADLTFDEVVELANAEEE